MSEIIDVLEALSTTEAIVKCGFCQGSGNLSFGQVHKRSNDECPICRGKGKLLVQAEQFPLVECARCQGTGSTYQLTKANESEVQKLIDHVCSSCGGAGCQAMTGNWQIVGSHGKPQNQTETYHLTGLTASEFDYALANKKDFTRCMICRRQPGDQSIGITDDAEPLTSTLKIVKYKKDCGGVVYTWPICVECALLVGLLS